MDLLLVVGRAETDPMALASGPAGGDVAAAVGALEVGTGPAVVAFSRRRVVAQGRDRGTLQPTTGSGRGSPPPAGPRRFPTLGAIGLSN